MHNAIYELFALGWIAKNVSSILLRGIILGCIFYKLRFIHALWIKPMIKGGSVIN